MVLENLVKDISEAIVAFVPPADLQLAAWFGTADRLAYVHPSGVLDLLGAESAKNETCGAIQFVTAVGPRSYWPQEEAKSYRDAVEAFRLDSGDVDDLAHAAKALVVAARHRELAWSRDEWQYRMMAAIAAWIYWDDEPGAARDAAQHAT